MRMPPLALVGAITLTVALAPSITLAQSATGTPTAAATAAPADHYTSTDTELGALLDDPAAKAILDKRVPGLTTNDQVDMARGMTLKAVQQYAPDQLSDKVLADIDADFAKLPIKK